MISPPAATVRDGDVISFLHQNLNDPNGEPKKRCAVVIRGAAEVETRRGQSLAEPPAAPSSTKVLIIFPTTKAHPFPSRIVRKNTGEARALGLSETSYFYARNIRFLERSKILRRIGPAPINVFLDLSALAERGLIELLGKA